MDEVVVVAGRLATPGLGWRWLHDHTADAISDALEGQRGRVCVLVPVAFHQH
jgi:hypothetical protein